MVLNPKRPSAVIFTETTGYGGFGVAVGVLVGIGAAVGDGGGVKVAVGGSCVILIVAVAVC